MLSLFGAETAAGAEETSLDLALGDPSALQLPDPCVVPGLRTLACIKMEPLLFSQALGKAKKFKNFPNGRVFSLGSIKVWSWIILC